MGFDPNQPRHPAGSSQGGEWRGAAGANITLESSDERAYTGQQISTTEALTKQETGAIGEAAAINYLKRQGLLDARPLNMAQNNFPIDVIEDHELIEVKTGLVSNGQSAQHWRATIGQPGKAEREWLKTASSDEKAAWNAAKSSKILSRKNAVLEQYTRRTGIAARGKTIGTIIDPDRKIVDVYEFDGFHLRIGWNSTAAKNAYKGSFSYAAAR